MKARGQFLSLPPLLVSIGAFGWVTGLWALSGALAVAAAAAKLLRWRWNLARPWEFVACSALTAAAFSLGAMLLASHPADPTKVERLAGQLALTGITVAIARLYLRDAFLGHGGTMAIGVLTVMACGAVRLGWEYAALVGAFVVAACVSLRLGSETHSSLKQLGFMRSFAHVSALAIAATFAVGTIAVLPSLHERAVDELFWLERSRTTSGFSQSMRLGALSDLLLSDEIALRVRGARTDYLRGAVYSVYVDGRWHASDPTETPVVTFAPGDVDSNWIEVRSERDESLFFLPIDADVVATPQHQMLRRHDGTARALGGERAEVVWFKTTEGASPVLEQPQQSEMLVPAELRAQLEQLAHKWTAGLGDAEERLAALERNLHGYRYSLRAQDADGADPLLAFLFVHRSGHCEYFASAMTLLARSIGIPARVVAGYRVSEYNAFGDYYVVRERNAHAWVEAYVHGQGWVPFEPTPPSSVAHNEFFQQDSLRALLDLVAGGAILTGVNPSLRALLVVALALVPAASGWAIWRFMRRWRRRDRAVRQAADDDATPRYVQRLFEVLARQGHRRAASQSLENFARQLRGKGAGDAADLVQSIAAFRYGGIGDPTALAQAVDIFTRSESRFRVSPKPGALSRQAAESSSPHRIVP